MIRRILLTLSGNPFTESVLHNGLELARRHGAEVTAVTIFDRDRAEAVGAIPVGAGRAARDLREYRAETVRERIDADVRRAEEAFADADVPLRMVREETDPLDRLLELSLTHDLTVLGLRGFFDFGVFRDPTTKIVRLLGSGVRPILAVAEETRPIRRVLVAYNGSPESSSALRDFVQVRPWDDLHLQVVCFDASLDGPALLRDVSAYLASHGLDVETEHRSEEPREALVPYAETWGADMIVMGATNRANLARRILGDTALEVVRTAEVPLFLSA